MALEMCFWLVDDATIQNLREAPHLLTDFLSEDNEPDGGGPNHRNVDMFHFILNGTEDYVGGIKDFFKGLDEAYEITIEANVPGTAERQVATAITSETTSQLLQAFRKLDGPTIRKRWSQLIRRRGLVEDENEPGLDEAEKKRRRNQRAEEEADPYFHESFAHLTQLCEQAVGQNKGLLWNWG